MPRYGRRGRPGLIGMAARTAVVAGTATAVSGNVSRRQQGRAQQAADAQAYEAQVAQEQAYAAQAPAPAAPAPAPVAQDPTQAKIEQLAQMHSQGLLTDEEFSAAKARALGI